MMKEQRPEDWKEPEPGEVFQVEWLASGSRGNCLLVRTPSCRILVDAGISARRIAVALGERGLEWGDLDGILVSHEHQDHTSGLRVIAARQGVPVWMTEMTRQAVGEAVVPESVWRPFSTGHSFELGPIRVEPFSVPHDAYDPVGFVLEAGGRRLGVATDLGYATALVKERLRSCQAIVLEANYDEVLLREDSKRPWAVKQRISARHGHLSNRKAAELAAEVAWDGLRWICLVHLSEDCNEPGLAVASVRESLEKSGFGAVQVAAALSNGDRRVWGV